MLPVKNEMRECLRCGAQMVEGGCLMSDRASWEITVSINKKKFRGSLGYPAVAVCPRCGELSLYIRDIERYRDKIEKFRHDLD